MNNGISQKNIPNSYTIFPQIHIEILPSNKFQTEKSNKQTNLYSGQKKKKPFDKFQTCVVCTYFEKGMNAAKRVTRQRQFRETLSRKTEQTAWP